MAILNVPPKTKQIKRVWKPLDVNGLRLYRVSVKFPNHPEWDVTEIIAAKSPSHAVQLYKDCYKETTWIQEPIISGSALNVLQPESWQEEE